MVEGSVCSRRSWARLRFRRWHQCRLRQRTCRVPNSPIGNRFRFLHRGCHRRPHPTIDHPGSTPQSIIAIAAEDHVDAGFRSVAIDAADEPIIFHLRRKSYRCRLHRRVDHRQRRPIGYRYHFLRRFCRCRFPIHSIDAAYEPIVAIFAIDRIVANFADESIITGAAPKDIVTIASVDFVDTGFRSIAIDAADEPVISIFAVDPIVTDFADESIIASATPKGIVAIATVEFVGAVSAPLPSRQPTIQSLPLLQKSCRSQVLRRVDRSLPIHRSYRCRPLHRCYRSRGHHRWCRRPLRHRCTLPMWEWSRCRAHTSDEPIASGISANGIGSTKSCDDVIIRATTKHILSLSTVDDQGESWIGCVFTHAESIRAFAHRNQDVVG